ncbi:hypothetical protein BH23GEM4_BH23GEM4_15140 [soil metagenome]
MRILYLVTAYPRGPSDVITPWLVETICRLRPRGVEVEVLAPAYRGVPGGVLEGVRVHRFRYAPARLETLTHDQTAPDRIRERPAYLALVPSYVAAGSLAAARLARTRRFDAVHAFWPLPHGIFGLAAKAAAGTPLVSTFFGVELTWLESDLPFLRPLLRRIVRRSDAVTAISSYTAAKLAAAVPGVRPAIIPFGAATESRAAAKASREPRTGGFALLFVGRLVERKGVAVLLEAMARLSADVQLAIVGDGPEREALHAQAERLDLTKRVLFEGYVRQDDLERHFAACDALVLPAVIDAKGDTEGLGVVLLEAMSYGKPVVASRAGGIVDIVRDGRNGLLVRPGDATALAAAIAALRDDPERAAALGAQGRQDVEREFSWEAIVDRLTAVYEEVVVSPPRNATVRRASDGG